MRNESADSCQLAAGSERQAGAIVIAVVYLETSILESEIRDPRSEI